VARPIPASSLLLKLDEVETKESTREARLQEEAKKLLDSVQPFKFEASASIQARRQGKSQKGSRSSGGGAMKKRSASLKGGESVQASASAWSRQLRGSTSQSHSRSRSLKGSRRQQTDSNSEDADGEGETEDQQSAEESEASEDKRNFKARPVPWAVKVSMLDTMMKEKEKEREKRVQERAQKLAQEAKLPPRMERWEKTIGQGKKITQALQGKGSAAPSDSNHDSQASAAPTAKPRRSSVVARPKVEKYDPDKDNTFKPEVNHKIPDFEQLQSKFDAELEKRKKAVREELGGTKVQEFQLSKSKKKAPAPEKPPQFRANPLPAYVTQMLGDIPPGERIHAATRRRLEEERARKEQEETEEKERAAKRAYLKPKIAQQISKIELGKGAAPPKAQKSALNQRSAQYAKELEAMQQRIRERPLLMEMEKREGDRVEARRKALLAMKESFERAGMSVKTYAKFFDAEELELLDIKLQ